MTIQFVEEARQELLDAIANYQQVRANLGSRFKDEVNWCVLWVADHPELYRVHPADYRRINLRVFLITLPMLFGATRCGCWPLLNPLANRCTGSRGDTNQVNETRKRNGNEIETMFVEEDDKVVNPLGVKGMGEFGIVGIPAAIANAFFHATGKRVRDLPITPDKLL